MKTSKKGISLIVLVITIIIMIIIAAAIILSLSSSGIIGQARNATSDSDIANAKQVVAVAKGEYELGEAEGYSNFKAYAEAKLEEAGYKVGIGEGAYEVTEDGTVYPYPTIPEGFVASKITTEDNVSEGLVIYEIPASTTVDWTIKTSGDANLLDVQETYNQYVWVPVDSINTFVRKDWGKGIKGDNFKNLTEPYSGLTLADETGEIAEYKKMYESVKENGGFYIARYEAGKEGNDTVVSKKGAAVWNKVAWGTDMTDVGTTGAVYLSRSLYPKSANSNVVSTLCYSVQWDAALRFISKVDSTYPTNSAGKGHYCYNEEGEQITETVGTILTGSIEAYKVNNIYDMAGNVFEWTMEAYSTDYRVYRGGYYDDGGTDYPASVRDGDGPRYSDVYYGFRPALYLK